MRGGLIRSLAPVLALGAIGLLVAGYILHNQVSFSAPSWLPGVGEDHYVVHAEFTAAQAVVPGQGQPVTVAGVRIGLVGAVTLRNGRAVVRMDIEPKRAPLYRDATIVLRPRTPLKDMYLAVDPGTPRAGKVPDGGTIPVAQTTPDVNADELLSSLDGDTRDYLTLLLQAGGTAFETNEDGTPDPAQVAGFRKALSQFAPLARDTRRVNEALAKRRRAIGDAVHHFSQISTELGGVDELLADFVTDSDKSLTTLADHSADLRAALDAFPGALGQTASALRAVNGLNPEVTRATRNLLPFARSLRPALTSTRSLAADTTDTIRDDLRPSARAVQPSLRALARGTAAIPRATPPLTATIGVLRRFSQALSYDPAQGDGYLFWAAWLAHNGASANGLQDAHGPMVRTLPLLSCPQLDALAQVQAGNETLNALITLSKFPDRTKICPQTPSPFGTTGTSGASGASGTTGTAGARARATR